MNRLGRWLRWHIGRILWNLLEPHCEYWMPDYIERDDFDDQIRNLEHEISCVEDTASDIGGIECRVNSLESQVEDLEEDVDDLQKEVG